MANSPDKGFLDQLREMRTTRTQQLRQSGQQASLLNKQISVLSNLDKTMNSVLRAQNSSIAALRSIDNKQSSISRQNEQVSKSMNNLASSVSRSMGGMASAIGKNTGGVASAVGSAGGAVSSAASFVASGIASALVRILPFAIAGVVGKMLIWDNIEDSTKKQLSESFGGMMKNVFGDLDTSDIGKTIKPIAKQLGDVFGALGDTLDGLSKKVSEIVGVLSSSIGGLTGIHLPGGANEALDKAKQNAKVLGTTGKKVGGDIVDVAKSIGNIDSSDIGSTVATAGVATAAVGAGVLVYGASAKEQVPAAAPESKPKSTSQPRMGTAKKPRMMNPQEIARMQEAMKSLQKKGVGKPSILQLIEELTTLRILAKGGDVAKRFLEFAIKYKLSTAGNVVQILFAMGLNYLIYNEVDSLYENDIIDEAERDDILSYLGKKEALMAGGGIIGGTLSGVVATTVGGVVTAATGGIAAPVATVAGIATVAAGSYGGSKVGEAIADRFLTTPDVLTKSYTPVGFAGENLYNPVGSVEGRRSSDDPRRTDRKPQGALTPQSASQTSNMTPGEISDYLVSFVKRKEGFRPNAYEDIKQLSIGYGTKARDKDEVIDEKEADKRLREELKKNRKVVVDFSNKNNRNWSQSQIDGLTSFIYNLGPGALDQVTAGGKRSDQEIATYMQKYVNADGKPNEGLAARRRGEVAMFGGKIEPAAPTPGTSFTENLARREAGGEKDKEVVAHDALAAGNLKAEDQEKKAKESRLAKLQESMGLNIFGALQKVLGPITEDLQKGYEENFTLQNIPSEPSVSTSDNSTTVVNVAGGGGGGGITYNSVTPPHNYNQQFNSLAGGYRA